jgi:hypothetical protein
LPTYVDPITDLNEIDKKKQDVLAVFNKLLAKPKPVAPAS